jgi:hypothetical protein
VRRFNLNLSRVKSLYHGHRGQGIANLEAADDVEENIQIVPVLGLRTNGPDPIG